MYSFSSRNFIVINKSFFFKFDIFDKNLTIILYCNLRGYFLVFHIFYCFLRCSSFLFGFRFLSESTKEVTLSNIRKFSCYTIKKGGKRKVVGVAALFILCLFPSHCGFVKQLNFPFSSSIIFRIHVLRTYCAVYFTPHKLFAPLSFSTFIISSQNLLCWQTTTTNVHAKQ